MDWKKLFYTITISFFVLFTTGCNSGSKNKGNSSAAETTFDLSLTSLYVGKNTKATVSKQTLAITASLTGELEAVNLTSGVTELYPWSAFLDEEALTLISNNTLALMPGDYRFSLVLSDTTHHYAGEAFATVMDGVASSIALSVKPIIGDTLVTASVIANLPTYKFSYDAADIGSLTLPILGVSVDGGAEAMFEINKATGLSETYLSLADGSHTIHLALYDGNIQIARSVPAQESVVVAEGEPLSVDLIPLYGETAFVLDILDGNATVKTTVPQEAIDEITLGNLQIIMLLSDGNTTYESTMTLLSENNLTYGTQILTGMQYGTFTLQLQFNDTTDLLGPVGICLADPIVLDKNGNTVTCDMTLKRRSLVNGSLLATVGINVFTLDNTPVAGAKVYANDSLIGLTGSGMFGTPGYLKTYLNAGNILLRAEDTTASGELNTTLASLDVKNFNITLATPLFLGDTWVQKSSGAIATAGHSAIVQQDIMYVFAGRDNSNNLWAYNITSDTWSQKTSGATARWLHTAVNNNGKMYIFGGTTTNDLWEYDIATDSWTQKNSGSTARNFHSAVAYNNKMYVFGGYSSGMGYLNDLWEYDILNDSWTQKASSPLASEAHSAIIYNNKMCIFGGDYQGTASNSIFEYDFATDIWVETNTVGPYIGYGHTAIEDGGKMYVFGGLGLSGYVNETWVFDFASNSWSQLTSGANTRYMHSAVNYNGNMYVFGGYDGSTMISDLWEYSIPQ